MNQSTDEKILQGIMQKLSAEPCIVLKESRVPDYVPSVGVACGENTNSESWISLKWNTPTVLFGFELYDYFKSIDLPARISQRPERTIHRYVIQNESALLGYFYAAISSPLSANSPLRWHPEIYGRVSILVHHQSLILKRGEDLFHLRKEDSAFIIGERIMNNIHITVTIGTLELSLQDITAIRPGTVIELSNPDCTPVTLSVGGFPIAEGKLNNQEIEIQKVHTKLLSQSPELYL